MGRPIPWLEASPEILRGIHTVITDVDDTLTHNSKIAGSTLDALERLRRTGIRVIPATAASAGWGSLIASLWPVEAVIAENGGVFFTREDGALKRSFFAGAAPNLATLNMALRETFPHLEAADDQPYRESCLAFKRLREPAENTAVLDYVARLGAAATVNSLWLLAWPGRWNKLSAARRLLAWHFDQDFDSVHDGILYVGDSENDQPMFAALPHSVGVSTVMDHPLTRWPQWITQGPGGDGFVEVADRLVAARD